MSRAVSEWVCVACGGTMGREAVKWKCCPTHCTERGDDVVCPKCLRTLHPGGVRP